MNWRFFTAGTIIGSVFLIIFLVKFLLPSPVPLTDIKTTQKPLNSIIETKQVPILMYHYVEYNKDPKDTIRASLTVTPYWFEKQLKQISDTGYQTIGLDEIFTTKIKKSIILTFDDGYKDFYTDVWPLLKKHRMKATVYLVANFLNRPNYLTTDMIKIMATDSAKLITFGSHTLNHQNLTQIPSLKAYDEIAGSKDYLEKLLGTKVSHFCYPYGAFNQSVIDMVKSAGYLTATTTLPGIASTDKTFELQRFRIGNHDIQRLFQTDKKVN